MHSGNELPRHYHHGNVKSALVDAAIKCIETEEPERLTLRRLANKVGVSPSAVYNHFKDKNALMLAVKMRLYDEINGYFKAYCQNTDEPEQQLLSMCLAYNYFAEENPASFQILFSSTLPMEWSTPEFVEVACSCLVETRKIVLRIYEKYQLSCSEEEVISTTLLLWSQLHGIIALKRSGSIRAAVTYQDWPESCALGTEQEVERLISNHVQMMINAIIASGLEQGSH